MGCLALLWLKLKVAPVAQLDRAPDYGTDDDFLKIHG